MTAQDVLNRTPTDRVAQSPRSASIHSAALPRPRSAGSASRPRERPEYAGRGPEDIEPRADGHAESDIGDREYAHLEPALARYAALAPTHPGRPRLREQLVTGYLPVARHIAQRYSQRGEPLEDLIQVASLALIGAVDRYESERGHHFLAFAIPTITGEIRRHFRDKTWAMRVPRRLQELNLSINKVIDELSQQLNRAPRPSEIAHCLNATTDEVVDALQAAQSYRLESLDQPQATNSKFGTVGDLLGKPDSRLDLACDAHAVAPHLAALAERERTILHLRFFEQKTQAEIAQHIGVSQMQVSRLLSQILTRLREAVNETTDADIATAAQPST
jgi:RNA polymerase sigma-B factor